MVDALALRADERRDKLRKASGRSKYPMIRRYLNGETRRSNPPSVSYTHLIEAIKAAGLEIISPVVVCNTPDYKEVKVEAGKHVKVLDEAMTLVK